MFVTLGTLDTLLLWRHHHSHIIAYYKEYNQFLQSALVKNTLQEGQKITGISHFEVAGLYIL